MKIIIVGCGQVGETLAAELIELAECGATLVRVGRTLFSKAKIKIKTRKIDVGLI